MSLSQQGSGKIPTSKTLRDEGPKNDHDDDRPYKKICRTSSSFVTSLPGDCLNLIFKCLETKDDRNSFGLTCHEWLRIQNNNHESLWYRNNYDPAGNYPKISPESLAIITCRLLIRFQHLKKLSLSRLPRITDFVTPQSQSFGSNVQSLSLDNCSDYCPDYSDKQLSLIFSWFPRLTYISLDSSDIADKGLDALAKCCSSLKTVDLQWCCSITDSGLSCLLQKCRELRSLSIIACSNITGVGFLGCARTLTHLEAGGCKLKPEGIRAIVSGGGLEYLDLKTPDWLAEVDQEGCIINTEAVIVISKGCPLLEELFLSNCEEVELQGWEAIGLNCKELESLFVMGCQKLCDMGLQAIWDGCDKLSELYIDREKHSCSSSALELFEHKKPGWMCLWP
ncbi:F-box/LRR-repeat protein 12-like [Papaver somniferum]|uniref:F-box/LRR-repeat protein 12-like n=1 Tax=Papaver somniferum TaxID=3469 RepID=UPI000E6FB281|nr:F-box/LRR-repeat protein 12-like [Papaver somniferum]